MILYFRISKRQKEALLSLYPDIKRFVEKTISDTADKIIMERDLFDIDEELRLYHSRRVLNDCNIHGRRCSQATKGKISKTLKAKGWKGIPLLEETRLKMLGRIVTKETRDKISSKNKGKKRTAKQRENLSLGHKGMKYKKRVVRSF